MQVDFSFTEDQSRLLEYLAAKQPITPDAYIRAIVIQHLEEVASRLDRGVSICKACGQTYVRGYNRNRREYCDDCNDPKARNLERQRKFRAAKRNNANNANP